MHCICTCSIQMHYTSIYICSEILRSDLLRCYYIYSLAHACGKYAVRETKLGIAKKGGKKGGVEERPLKPFLQENSYRVFI